MDSIGAGKEIRLLEGGLTPAECNNVDGGGSFQEVEIEVAIDSGAVSHVCADAHTPGYAIEETAASRAKANFIVGDGATIPNDRMKRVNMACAGEMMDGDCKNDGDTFSSVFQITRVTRPSCPYLRYVTTATRCYSINPREWCVMRRVAWYACLNALVACTLANSD